MSYAFRQGAYIRIAHIKMLEVRQIPYVFRQEAYIRIAHIKMPEIRQIPYTCRNTLTSMQRKGLDFQKSCAFFF